MPRDTGGLLEKKVPPSFQMAFCFSKKFLLLPESEILDANCEPVVSTTMITHNSANPLT